MIFIILIVCLIVAILCVSLIIYFVNKKENPNPPVPPIPPEPTKDVLVAVGVKNNSNPNPSTLAYSKDNGETWIDLGDSYFTQQGNGVFYYNKRWVAVGQGTNSIIYSDDGINWIPSSSGNNIFTEAFSVYHNGIIWMAIGNGQSNVATSEDGINWTKLDTLSLIDLTFVSNLYANQGRFFITVGSFSDTLIYYSVDNGQTWQNNNPNTINYDIYCNNQKCISTGRNNLLNGWDLRISNDNGSNWLNEPQISQTTYKIYYSNDKWLISYSDTFIGQWKYSEDNGNTWIEGNNLIFYIYGFYNSKNRWFIYGEDSAIIYSADLVNWNDNNIPSMNTILSVY